MHQKIDTLSFCEKTKKKKNISRARIYCSSLSVLSMPIVGNLSDKQECTDPQIWWEKWTSICFQEKTVSILFVRPKEDQACHFHRHPHPSPCPPHRPVIIVDAVLVLVLVNVTVLHHISHPQGQDQVAWRSQANNPDCCSVVLSPTDPIPTSRYKPRLYILTLLFSMQLKNSPVQCQLQIIHNSCDVSTL